MEDYRLGAMETRFAELIWQHAPVASGELVKLCQAAFGWKKSTTYTMLRRLCERGLFQNEGGTVSALMTPLKGAQNGQLTTAQRGGMLSLLDQEARGAQAQANTATALQQTEMQGMTQRDIAANIGCSRLETER